MDSKTVSLGSNYVSNDPICTIKRWDKAVISYKDVSYPQIVLAYDKDRGGVGLADILTLLYRIKVKTKHRYIEIPWYLVDINTCVESLSTSFSTNALPIEVLYCPLKCLDSCDKPVIVNRPGRPWKQASCDNSENSQSKRASVPTPCLNICYDQIGHWPEPKDMKSLSSVPNIFKNKMFKMRKLSLCLRNNRFQRLLS